MALKIVIYTLLLLTNFFGVIKAGDDTLINMKPSVIFKQPTSGSTGIEDFQESEDITDQPKATIITHTQSDQKSGCTNRVMGTFAALAAIGTGGAAHAIRESSGFVASPLLSAVSGVYIGAAGSLACTACSLCQGKELYMTNKETCIEFSLNCLPGCLTGSILSAVCSTIFPSYGLPTAAFSAVAGIAAPFLTNICYRDETCCSCLKN